MKNKRGITLIALVITIIVLLILAGISLSLVLGENGILTKAKDSKIIHNIAEAKETVEVEAAAYVGEYYEKKADGSTNEMLDDYVASKMLSNNGKKYGEYTLTINGKNINLTSNGTDAIVGTILSNGAIKWGNSANTNGLYGGFASPEEVTPTEYFTYQILENNSETGIKTAKITGINFDLALPEVVEMAENDSESVVNGENIWKKKAEEDLPKIVVPDKVKLDSTTQNYNENGDEYQIVDIDAEFSTECWDVYNLFSSYYEDEMFNTEIVLPEGIEVISGFSDNIKCLNIPSTVKQIKDNALSSYRNEGTTYNISTNLISIGKDAFSDNITINYDGTIQQWRNIEFANKSRRNWVSTATINFVENRDTTKTYLPRNEIVSQHYYVDYTGEGTVEGIIFINTNFSTSSWFEYKDYYISQKNYEGDFGTLDVITPYEIGGGSNKFSVLALDDFGATDYTWYNNGVTQLRNLADNVFLTKDNQGYGTATKTWYNLWNTEKYGTKSNSDLWSHIDFMDDNKGINGKGFIPTVSGWRKICSEFNLTDQTTAANCGFQAEYWTSLHCGHSSEYIHDFEAKYSGLSEYGKSVSSKAYVRLISSV